MRTKLFLTALLLMVFKSSFGQVNFKVKNKNPKEITKEKQRQNLEDFKKIDKYFTFFDTVYKDSSTVKSLNNRQLFYEFQDALESVVDSINNPLEKEYIAYYNAKIKALESKIQVAKAEINQEKIGTIEKAEKKINGYQKKINLYNKKIEEKDFSRAKAQFLFNPEDANMFFKTMYGEEGKSRFNFLNSSGVNFGDKSASIYSELASGNMDLIRLSFGTMIANADVQETENEGYKEEAYQRLANNGGNTVLKAEYPLFRWYATDNQYNCIARAIGKASADFPVFGTKTDDFAGSLSLEFDLYLDASTSNNDIRLYANLNSSVVNGTETFKTNLEVEDKNFTFTKITFGLVILQKFNFSVMFKTFSSEKTLENKNVMIGGSLLF